MSQLLLVCFGTFQATLAGERLTSFHSVKVQALLAYLVLEATRPHTREALMALFWPDDAPQSAQQSLRQALYALRRLLGDTDNPAREPFLLVTRQSVQFNLTATYALDVATFLRHLAQDEQEQAVALYHAELLTGLTTDSAPFEEWLRAAREYFHTLALNALNQLTQQRLDSGDYAGAALYARRQLTLEPWREEAHRQVMTALARSGERSAALAQYESCRRVLVNELGVEPDNETRAIYEQIKAGKLRGSAAPRHASPPTPPTRHNLPAELDLFLGRELELAQIEQSLRNPAQRLVTIAGIAGIGKTSLALRVAHRFTQGGATGTRFPDGVFFTALGASTPRLETIALPATKIADALGISDLGTAETTAAETYLANALCQRQLLLVLDDVELLPANCDLILLLLQKAPGLVILATTHAPLYMKGEQVIRLEGLTFPTAETTLSAQHEGDHANHAALAPYSALQLFVRTAQAAAADLLLDGESLQAITHICRLLEGMPLGIQLAATWTRVLSCTEILSEIEQNFDFLSTAMSNSTPHHRSLRAVLDATWRLLTPREQLILSRLSVFRGGFTRESAATVAEATLSDLATLVDKSLVKRRTVSQGTDGNLPALAAASTRTVRYDLLEILRLYAAEQLERSQETASSLARHADYYSTLLAAQHHALQGAGQVEALWTIHAELENIRALYRGFLRTPTVTQSTLRQLAASVESLFVFYDIRSWFQEGEALFRQTADLLAAGEGSDRETGILYAQLRARQGWFTFYLGRQAESQQLLAQSLQQLQAHAATVATIFNHNYLGAVARHRGDLQTAQFHLDRALQLAHTHGDRFGASIAINNLAQVAAMQGDQARAGDLCRQSLALKRAIGDRRGVMFCLSYLGELAHSQGAPQEARRRYQESLNIAQELGDRRSMALTLRHLGEVAASLGEVEQAQTFYTQSIQLLRAINSWREVCLTLCKWVDLALTAGQQADTAAALAEALQLALTLDDPGCMAEGLLSASRWQVAQGYPALALAHLAALQTHPLSSAAVRQRAAQLQGQFAGESAAALPVDPTSTPLAALIEASLIYLPEPTTGA